MFPFLSACENGANRTSREPSLTPTDTTGCVYRGGPDNNNVQPGERVREIAGLVIDLHELGVSLRKPTGDVGDRTGEEFGGSGRVVCGAGGMLRVGFLTRSAKRGVPRPQRGSKTYITARHTVNI